MVQVSRRPGCELASERLTEPHALRVPSRKDGACPLQRGVINSVTAEVAASIRQQKEWYRKVF